MFNIQVYQAGVQRAFLKAHETLAQLPAVMSEFVHPANMPQGFPMDPRSLVYKAIQIGLLSESEGYKVLREARY